MEERQWTEISMESCPVCNSKIESYSKKEWADGYWVWDDDDVRCTNCCAKGRAVMISEYAWEVNWDEDTFVQE